MQKITTLLAALILAAGLAFLASVLIAYPVKWLWNWIVPTVLPVSRRFPLYKPGVSCSYLTSCFQTGTVRKRNRNNPDGFLI
jgi:hypothetical protein